jgi:hypothetical protein
MLVSNGKQLTFAELHERLGFCQDEGEETEGRGDEQSSMCTISKRRSATTASWQQPAVLVQGEQRELPSGSHLGLGAQQRPPNRHPDSGMLTARLNGRDNANMKSITNERGVDRIVFIL